MPLANHDALFHVDAKVFKRSEGRSAVAAAAYRSASMLLDNRTGELFDYRRKHVVESFILAPTDAPKWTQHREDLWNRVELSERKKNAVVAREMEISIPRDLPRDQWKAFAGAAVAPYVEAGAVVDVAIHCPKAIDGQDQPHIHAMITLRKLDSATVSGFTAKKNDDLIRIFESGGRHGGERKDALAAERARLAHVMNRFLEQSGSHHRADHRSYKERGIDRIPEPLMGEQRIHASKARKRGDRRTDEVFRLRKAKAAENDLNQQIRAIEEEIMTNYPQFQTDTRNGIKPRHRQDFKANIMAERLSGVNYTAEALHMVDISNPKLTRINTRDGGWVELQNRRVTVYGTEGYADGLAHEIVKAGHAEDITRLREMVITKRGARPRQRKLATPSQIPDNRDFHVPESTVETLGDRWRSRGFTHVTENPDGVWINLGQTRLQDLGDEVRVHGYPTDAAILALLAKAADEWDSALEVHGSRDFKDRVWLEAQRQNIEVYDPATDQLYEPSPAIRAAWEADCAKRESQTLNLAGVHQRKKTSELIQKAAQGSREALAALKQRDGLLWAFLVNLDEEQLEALRLETVESLEPQLDGFRAVGHDIKQEGDTPGSATDSVTAYIEESLAIDDDFGDGAKSDFLPVPKDGEPMPGPRP